MDKTYFITDEPDELVANERTPISWLGKWGDWNNGYGKHTFALILLYVGYHVYTTGLPAITNADFVGALIFIYFHYLFLLFIAYHIYKVAIKDNKRVLVINRKGILWNEEVFYWGEVARFQLSLEKDKDKRRHLYYLYLTTTNEKLYKIDISDYDKKVADIEQALHKNTEIDKEKDAGYTQKLNEGKIEKPQNIETFFTSQPVEVIVYHGNGPDSYLFAAVPLSFASLVVCAMLSYWGIPVIALALYAWYKVLRPGIWFIINDQGITTYSSFGLHRWFYPWSAIAAYHFTAKVVYGRGGSGVVNKIVFRKKAGGWNLTLPLYGMENKFDEIRRKVEWLAAQHQVDGSGHPLQLSEGSPLQFSTGSPLPLSDTNNQQQNIGDFIVATLKNTVSASRSRRMMFGVFLFLQFLAVPLFTYLLSVNYPDTYEGLTNKTAVESDLTFYTFVINFILLLILFIKSPAETNGIRRFGKFLIFSACFVLWFIVTIYTDVSHDDDNKQLLAAKAFKEGKAATIYGRVIFASYKQQKFFPDSTDPRRGFYNDDAAPLSPATNGYLVIVQLNDSLNTYPGLQDLYHHFNDYTHDSNILFNIPVKNPDLSDCLQFSYDFPKTQKSIPPLPTAGKYVKIQYDSLSNIIKMDTDTTTAITACYDSIPKASLARIKN